MLDVSFGSVLAFATVAFVVVQGLQLVAPSRSESRSAALARERLQRFAARLQAPESDAHDDEEDDATVVRDKTRHRSPAVDSFLHAFHVFDRLELILYRAGITVPLAKFLTMNAAAALLALAPAMLALGDFTLAAGVAGGVGLAPWLLVWQRQRSREKLIEQQLIGALELMSRALRAGRSVTGSFRIVGDESPDPIGAEFGQLANEIQLGLDLRRGLANLVRRVDSDFIRFFNTAVLIQRDAGGNLAELVDNLSQLIRERMDFQGKVNALTAQAAMASNMLVAIVLGLMMFLYVKNPTFLEPLWTTAEGMKMLRIGIGLIVGGYLLGRRMARITV